MFKRICTKGSVGAQAGKLKIIPLQEKTNHNTWVCTAVQQTSHTNQLSISEGNGWSGKSQKERSRNVKGL